MWRVESDHPRVAQRHLRESKSIVAVAQIGTALRVLALKSAGDDAVAALLRAGGIEANVERVAPNLEDVFVSATRAAPVGSAA